MAKKRVTLPPDARRRALMDAARDLFARQGFAGTAISDIVRAAGVAQGTFYWYFPSKQAVLYAIMGDMMEQIGAVVAATVARPDLDAVAKLRQTEEAVLALLSGEAGGFLIFRLMADTPLQDQVMAAWEPRLLALAAAVVRQGVAEGTFQVRHPEAAAAFVLTLMERFFAQMSREQQPAAAPRPDLHAALWEFVLGGLGARERTSGRPITALGTGRTRPAAGAAATPAPGPGAGGSGSGGPGQP